MNHPETEGFRQEDEQSAELKVSKPQREALLIAVTNEIQACEQELQRLRDEGLTTAQESSDYGAIASLLSQLEELRDVLPSS